MAALYEKSPAFDRLSRRHGGMSDMSDMGMDAGSAAGFIIVNSALARAYWYIIAAVLGFTVLVRIVHVIQTRIRLQSARTRGFQYPTKPRNFFLQAFATGSAIVREASAPEYCFTNPWFSWLSPPPLGRSLLLLAYWIMITYMLCVGAIINDPYYWERIAFRAAWISVTQVPFVYLLASKASVISLLSGSSYERLNWLHRWASRTLFVSVTIHGGFFYVEWYRADFVELEISAMPMVKYGMGAWGVLLWTLLSSVTPIRRLSYEIFVLQHLAAAGVFLWLLWVHVPDYAMYNLWLAIAAVAVDKIIMYSWTCWTNVSLRSGKDSSGPLKTIGHRADIRAVNKEMTEVIVHNVTFSWAAGQHVYLRIPILGPLESHPFTISNAYQNSSSASTSVQLLIEAKEGFTRRLHRRASKTSAGSKESYQSVTAFVTGPFGRPPLWTTYETLVLISASTGASFTVPILESVVNGPSPGCISRIDVVLVVKRRVQISYWMTRLEAALVAAEAAGIDLSIRVAITCETCGCCGGPSCNCHDGLWDEKPSSTPAIALGNDVHEISPTTAVSSLSKSESVSVSVDEITEAKTKEMELKSSTGSEKSSLMSKNRLILTPGRPNIEECIRNPVEASGGETSVVVCGGRSLVACVRNRVASLSDERAVHKGTGAQGIHLHTEQYCF